jgi:hypothetical protein
MHYTWLILIRKLYEFKSMDPRKKNYWRVFIKIIQKACHVRDIGWQSLVFP